MKRISPLRVVGVLAATAAVVTGTTVWAVSTIDDAFGTEPTIDFAPYVDVTLDPVGHFEDPQVNSAALVTLGFVVADTADPCTPSWGTYYGLDAAGRALDLDRRIVRYRERGGDVVVSFGGQANDELAVVCDDAEALTDAYRAVIDRYELDVVDFDIEGPALADHEANERRAEAIAELQSDDGALEVWLTLPVAPTGLTDDGLAVVDGLLAAGVDLSGVNAMTMNYVVDEAGGSMSDTVAGSLEGVRRQLDGAFQRAGRRRAPDEVWASVGATPMIGQNDVPGDVFTLADAADLVDFASEVGLGRLSMWSLHRDGPCGAAAPTGQVSNTCSGVEQEPHAFADVFLTAATRAERGNDAASVERGSETRDDPATSPYPIWRTGRIYEQGDKVVWRGGVYEAKWYSDSDLPDEPVEHLWDTPWRYLGPVLDVDADLIEAARPEVDGAWVDWSADAVYVAGDEVRHDDQVFRAEWWTQGVEPDDDPDRPFDHPWSYLGDVAPEDDETP